MTPMTYPWERPLGPVWGMTGYGPCCQEPADDDSVVSPVYCHYLKDYHRYLYTNKQIYSKQSSFFNAFSTGIDLRRLK